ncbi:MAG TPA: sugar ABC transporter permease [Bacilli bacterium]|nr:sugar ABC transporter permease [Bacilli bacterium]
MLEYKKDGWKAAISLAPAMILLAVFTFWPILNAFRMTFMNDYSMSSGKWDGIGIRNFIYIFKDPTFWTALKNTCIMVFISVPITIILGLFIAVGLNSIKKLQSTFQTIFFLPYVTNTIALGLVFGAMFHQYDGFINQLFNKNISWIGAGASYTNAMIVLMIYTVWNGLAFKIIVFLSGLQSIDKQYYQAAQIDATPRGRVFRRITVPLLSPMILYITITSLIGAFKAYSSVISIFGTGKYGPGSDPKLLITIVGYVYEKLWASGVPLGEAAAGSLILFAIILAITLVQLQVGKKRVHY